MYRRNNGLLGRGTSITAFHPALRTHYVDRGSALINWERLRQIVNVVVDTLMQKYPQKVNLFNTWFRSVEYSEAPPTSSLMLTKFKEGYPVLRGVVDAIQEEQRLVCVRARDIVKAIGRDAAKNSQAVIDAKKRLDYLSDLQSVLIGCSGDSGESFLGIYDQLMSAYPRDPTIRNASMYLTHHCLILKESSCPRF